MKVLFVTFEHYPDAGACTSLLRKMFFEGGLLQAAGEVHVLTTKREIDEADLEICDGVTVHRTLPSVLLKKEDVKELFSRRPWKATRVFLTKSYYKLRDTLSGKRPFLKDNVTRTFARAIAALLPLDFDVIVPVCGHYELAAAVLRLKKKTLPPVVFYQVDPCASNAKYQNELAARAAHLEREIFCLSDAVVTTPLLLPEIAVHYPENIRKKTVALEFPNVSCAELAAPAGAKPGDEIACVFAGGLYPVARDPRYTLELFSRISNERIRLHFIGADRECMLQFTAGEDLGERVRLHGRLPLEEAQKKIREADVLVNIGNRMKNQVPSKLFEYISALKPILNVCTNPDCPTLPYLARYPLALSVVEGEESAEKQARQIEAFILENAGKSADRCRVLKEFSDCTAAHCAETFSEVLRTAAADKHTQR